MIGPCLHYYKTSSTDEYTGKVEERLINKQNQTVVEQSILHGVYQGKRDVSFPSNLFTLLRVSHLRSETYDNIKTVGQSSQKPLILRSLSSVRNASRTENINQRTINRGPVCIRKQDANNHSLCIGYNLADNYVFLVTGYFIVQFPHPANFL